MKCFVSTFDGNSTLHCRSDSLLSRCKARSRGNVECRMEELECAGYQLPALGQRCEQRDGMVETFDCDTAGLPGQRDERGELGHGTLSFR